MPGAAWGVVATFRRRCSHGRDDELLARLSDRQRGTLSVAHELGSCDRPRGGTHEDVAAELDGAPLTASDHLQKAESKVIESVLQDED